MGRGLTIMASQKLPSRKGQEVPNVGEKSAQKVPSSEFTTLTVAGSELKLWPAAQQQGAQAPWQGELQYLGQVEHIMRRGFKKEYRMGTGTLLVFSMQARYNPRGDRG